MNELERLLADITERAEDIYALAEANEDSVSRTNADKILAAIENFDAQDFYDDAYEDGKKDGIEEGESRAKDGPIDALMGEIDRLHEAVCEGRKQDAIDILNDILPNANLRSVKSQNSLFPDRVIA